MLHGKHSENIQKTLLILNQIKSINGKYPSLHHIAAAFSNPIGQKQHGSSRFCGFSVT